LVHGVNGILPLQRSCKRFAKSIESRLDDFEFSDQILLPAHGHCALFARRRRRARPRIIKMIREGI
jgi:hypothetical protein